MNDFLRRGALVARHDAHKEPDCAPMDWSFDDMELKRDALRKAMYDEAADWHPYVRHHSYSSDIYRLSSDP